MRAAGVGGVVVGGCSGTPTTVDRRHRASRAGPGASGGAPPTVDVMTTWEYATVPLLVHATKQILDSWGEDGWELVQVVPGPNPENLVAYLKRPRAAS